MFTRQKKGFIMKIKFKLLLTFGLLIVLSFGIVGINLMTYQTMESDADFVNYSGKLRATSYKMAHLSNILMDNRNQESTKELEESIVLFDTILMNITSGNDALGLTKLVHKPTMEELSNIEKVWNNKYKVAFTAVLKNRDADSVALMNSEITAYVNEINDMVTSFSEYAQSKVMNAKIINGILSLFALVFGLVSFYLLNKGIRKPILGLNEDLKALSQGNGDLTKRIQVNSKDEIGELTIHFNDFIGNIHQIVVDISKISGVLSKDMNSISGTTEELTKSTELIAMSSMEVAEGSAQQNNKLEELNALVEKIKLNIEAVSQKGSQTLSYSEESQKSVEQGNKQVDIQAIELGEFIKSIKTASVTVEDLNQASEQIRAIVGLIHSISSQTNLLALNASIEAARAGEYGRGFAVVADEIRKLAEETSVSAKQINEIVASISDKTVNVKTSMDQLVDKTKSQEDSMEKLKKELVLILDQAGMTLKESKGIMSISSQVNNEFKVITSSARDIQGVSMKNSENTQDVAAAVEEQTASFQEVAANISSINELASELDDIVGKFKI